MATIEEALYAELAGNAGVAALVSTRIYPSVIPQDSALPAIAYQRIGGLRLLDHGNDMYAALATFQVTAVADDYAEVKGVIRAIVAMFPFVGSLGSLVTVFLGTVDNEVDDWNPTIEMPATRLDLRFLYAEQVGD